jgi:predicted SAM-dependent methyltransferase
MNKEAIKRFPLVRYLVQRRLRRAARKLEEQQRSELDNALQQFLAQSGPKRFQFGSGGHRLDGWLNTDFEPWCEGVFHLDMRNALPFPDSVLDVAASEHCFEHFSYDEGKRIALELFRCLKPGGLLRMSMPDLDRYIALWNESLTPEQIGYMRAYVGIEHAGDPVSPCMTLNLAMRSFGHKFIYDRPTIKDLLSKAGFVDVRFATPGDRSVLRLTEFEVRVSQGNRVLDGYETMIVEAQKPE